MRMTMKERQKAVAVVAPRYQKARKKQKGQILDEFTKLTGYGRKYAAQVVRSHGKKVRIGTSLIVQGDIRNRAERKRGRLSFVTTVTSTVSP